MDILATVASEVNGLRALGPQIASSIAKLHPTGAVPEVGECEEIKAADRFSLALVDASFPVIFPDGTEWLINLPLYNLVSKHSISKKLDAEVSTMKWVRENTQIPVPRVHAVDLLGHADWNATHRPCIVIDKMPGRHLEEDFWEQLSREQHLHILDQVAKIQAQLYVHPFPAIGSLYYEYDDQNVPQNLQVLRFISHATDSYCVWYRAFREFFKAARSPYTRTLQFITELLNMRLLHEAICSPTMTDVFLYVWVARSLVPSLCSFSPWNNGPFSLTHGLLGRSALLFDDDFNITAVTNWGFSTTMPRAFAGIPPPIMSTLKLGSIQVDYLNVHLGALRKYEKEFSTETLNNDSQLTIADLSPRGYQLGWSPIEDLVRFAAKDSPFEDWQNLFKTAFGTLADDKSQFHAKFREVPGLTMEFSRIRAFVESKMVSVVIRSMLTSSDGDLYPAQSHRRELQSDQLDNLLGVGVNFEKLLSLGLRTT